MWRDVHIVTSSQELIEIGFGVRRRKTESYSSSAQRGSGVGLATNVNSVRSGGGRGGLTTTTTTIFHRSSINLEKVHTAVTIVSDASSGYWRKKLTLSGGKDEHRNNRRILMTVNDKSHLLQASTEITTVESESSKSILSFVSLHEMGR